MTLVSISATMDFRANFPFSHFCFSFSNFFISAASAFRAAFCSFSCYIMSLDEMHIYVNLNMVTKKNSVLCIQIFILPSLISSLPLTASSPLLLCSSLLLLHSSSFSSLCPLHFDFFAS